MNQFFRPGKGIPFTFTIELPPPDRRTVPRGGRRQKKKPISDGVE